MKKLDESECLDEPSKEILKTVIEENFAKNTRIAELENEVAQMKIKVNQLERYQSKVYFFVIYRLVQMEPTSQMLSNLSKMR